MNALLETTTSLINAGRFHEAEFKLRAAVDTPAKNLAVYWVQLTQLALLKGNGVAADHCIIHAYDCADWDGVLHEGGFHRDWAHMLIRQASVARRSSSTLKQEIYIREARHCLAIADELFKDNKSLLGSVTMAKAKLEYAEQNYDAAVDLHLLADTQLTDPVWRRNNQFHLLRASQFVAHPKSSDFGWALVKKILKEDPSRKHKIAAIVTILTGKFGCWLYDRIAA